MPELRSGVGCPSPYDHVLLGERFGQWPWTIRDAPADDVLFYRNLLAEEGEIMAALAGLPRTERLIREE